MMSDRVSRVIGGQPIDDRVHLVVRSLSLNSEVLPPP
jgi:hypothetical protein